MRALQLHPCWTAIDNGHPEDTNINCWIYDVPAKWQVDKNAEKGLACALTCQKQASAAPKKAKLFV